MGTDADDQKNLSPDPLKRCACVAEVVIESYSWKSVPEQVTIAILKELRDIYDESFRIRNEYPTLSTFDVLMKRQRAEIVVGELDGLLHEHKQRETDDRTG